MDPRSAPETVLRGHTPDEGSHFGINAWSSRSPPLATAPASTEPFAMPTGNRGWLDQHQRFPPPRPHARKQSQRRRSDGRKRRSERPRTPSWWRRARISRRRSLRVHGADRSPATIHMAARIARRMASNDATSTFFAWTQFWRGTAACSWPTGRTTGSRSSTKT